MKNYFLEPTLENWEILIKRARILRERVLLIKPGKNSFFHVARNLLPRLEIYKYDDLRTEERFRDLKEQSDFLCRYFELLDNFPEFAKAELTMEEGMFPDIYKKTYLAGELVKLFEERLR